MKSREQKSSIPTLSLSLDSETTGCTREKQRRMREAAPQEKPLSLESSGLHFAAAAFFPPFVDYTPPPPAVGIIYVAFPMVYIKRRCKEAQKRGLREIDRQTGLTEMGQMRARGEGIIHTYIQLWSGCHVGMRILQCVRYFALFGRRIMSFRSHNTYYTSFCTYTDTQCNYNRRCMHIALSCVPILYVRCT